MLIRFTLALLLASASFASDKISGAGASFPASLYYNWAYNYRKDTRNIVNYQSIGSGGGIKQVTQRIVGFGASDKPLTTQELTKAKLLQFPAVIGSIVIALNVAGIPDETLKLKNSVVAGIFAGEITLWNDAAIVVDNKNLKLPNEKIVVIHRSDGSGTTYNFTYYLSESSQSWKQGYGIGKAINWAVGIGGKGNEGVSSLIKQTPNSIGYIENVFKTQNHLSAAILQTKSGKWVKATNENFQAAAKYAVWTEKNNFFDVLVLEPGDTSYPLVAATFILLPVEKSEMNKKVIKFFDYAFKQKEELANKLGYILPTQDAKAAIREYWATNIK